MAVYAIMRCKKLATMGCVASALQHCYRERETPNADSERTPNNEQHVSHFSSEAMGKMRELLPEKRRKDAVLTVEYVMTASPEWWTTASPEQQKEFFKRSKQWLADKYGQDRIIAAVVHNDEISPHLSAFVVPLTQDGRLSAKEFIGNRTKMTNDQTTFAEAVRDLGLERGLQGSKAQHQAVKRHYAVIEKGIKSHIAIGPENIEPKQLKPESFLEKVGIIKTFETTDQIANRLTEEVNEQFASTIAIASQSHENAHRATKLQRMVQTIGSRLKALQEPLNGLKNDQMKKLFGIAALMRQENEQEKLIKRHEHLLTRKHKRKNKKGNKNTGIAD
ncbi:MobV family relaxase [Bartonella sp. AU55XJBT]|uniref:MobV family relaxase n=1 Tax=Bartonella sp. AU55XJBT TaxID=3019091 RepID=UPI002361D7E7|nr:MobV family relaxase [Bartonella sp. AU55XJBT]